MTDNRKIIEDYILDNKEKFYRLAFTYTKNKDDSFDVVHDAVLKALRSSETLKRPEYIKTWFYNILVHAAIDFIRKNKKYILTDDNMVLDSNGEYDNYEDIDLKRTLDLLSYEQRLVISMRYFEDLKLQEIAVILDENINTVKSRLYTALKLLKIEITSKEAR